MTKDNIKKGDWVYSYTKGIYRVERIVKQYYEENDQGIGKYKIGEEFGSMFFLKQLLSSQFKKYIFHEICSDKFVSPLNKSDYMRLHQIIKKNPSLINELNNYNIPGFTVTYYLQLQVKNKNLLKKIDLLKEFILKGKTITQIKRKMASLSLLKLISSSAVNYELCLFNYDLEFKGKQKVWRDMELYEKHSWD